jgi:hypothetical protein
MEESVWVSLLRLNVAFTSLMNVCIQLVLRLPKMRDQKVLMRCGLSFSEYVREQNSFVFNYKGGQYIRNGE